MNKKATIANQYIKEAEDLNKLPDEVLESFYRSENPQLDSDLKIINVGVKMEMACTVVSRRIH